MKNGLIQMRVNGIEREAILRGAKRAGQTITEFIKTAVLLKLADLSGKPQARDAFSEALERLDFEDKVDAPANIRKMFPKIRAETDLGKYRGLNKSQALQRLENLKAGRKFKNLKA